MTIEEITLIRKNMNNLDKEYQMLLEYILGNGVEKEDRTGTGTISTFGWQIRHNMQDGFPLLTTKKMAFKTMVTELLWFLKGDTNIKYLVDNGCNIWNGDAFGNYWESNKLLSNPKWLKPVTYSNGNVGAEMYNMEEFINKIKTDDEFAKKWGELGPIYGAQWRSWGENKEWNNFVDKSGISETQKLGTDQIQNLINDLKTNPDSRRLMVNAWNVGELDQMVLPPCHYGFQVYTRELSLEERLELIQPYGMDALKPEAREKWMEENNIPTRAISLMFNMRSVDVPLGLPFNIASYALLLKIIGKTVNMIPDELVSNMGDCHIYKNQIDGVKEQLTREPYTLPKLSISDDVNFTGTLDDFLNSCLISDLKIEGYRSHPTIKIPLSN